MKHLRLALFTVFFLLWAFRVADSEPFDVRVFGDFGRMLHSGDTRGVVKLKDIVGLPGAYGVGALADLRGEILLWDGKFLVSRGYAANGTVESAAPGDEAVFFVEARVEAWDELKVPKDMTRTEFELFMRQHAERRGLNTEHAFPFAVKGNFSRIVWHVVTGAPVEHANQHREGSKIHLQGHARNRVFDQTNATGLLLGFQSGAALEGVISHPGERFHLHYVDSEFSVSGHVDDYQITAGAVLLIPRR